MQTQDVKVTRILADMDDELSSDFFQTCCFCSKLFRVSIHNFKSCKRLSGCKTYCPFCLRNDHHLRSSRHILIMSYRAIIAYYYYRFYDSKNKRLWYSQIDNYITRHQMIGMQSPVFTYDPATMLWFVDFNKIGVNRKSPIEEVQVVVKMMLDTLELETHCSGRAYDLTLQKLDKAVSLFYQQRKRPKDKRMLIPTLSGVVSDSEEFLEQTRWFEKKDFVLK